jgi:DNA replication ATP-dependent helicase Dna2
MIGRNELAASIMYHRELQTSKASSSEDESYIPATPPTQRESTSSNENNFLPPPIDEEYQCSKCYVRDACALYRTVCPRQTGVWISPLITLFQAVEHLPPSPIPELSDKTSHLTPTQKDFFAQWETLIALEEQDMVRFRKELWTMGAEEREKHGRCFARMVPGPWEKRDGKFVYEFTRAPAPETTPESVIDLTMNPSTPKKSRGSSPIDLTSSPAPHYQMGNQLQYSFGSADSLLNGHIVKGDAVTISIDPGLLAFARGYVMDITTKSLTVAFDQELPLEGVAIRKHSKLAAGPVAFRIDKDDYSGGMARLRSNLAALFYRPGDERRLRLVVDLTPPRFLSPGEDDEKIPDSRAQLLNPNQRAAMELVLRAQDYALVLGMPGTGKTTMVAELIKELVRRGKSVLLTSYTHSAVDTILLKLLDVDFDVLRLGNVDKVSRLQEFLW